MKKRLIRLVVWLLSWIEDHVESLHEWIGYRRLELQFRLRNPTEYILMLETETGRTFRYAKGYDIPEGFTLLYDHVPKWAKDLPVKSIELGELDAILKGLYLDEMSKQLNRSSMWGTGTIEPLIPFMTMKYGKETVITNLTKEMKEDEV